MHHWSLPRDIRLASGCRALDEFIIQRMCIPGYVLMVRAAQAAFDVINARFDLSRQSLTVWCGSGNNAGDGYALARLALEQGVRVQAIEVSPSAHLTGEASQAYTDALNAGVELIPYDAKLLRKLSGIQVDALLGTGIKGALREPIPDVIDALNQAQLPVVALDVPTGLNPDTGYVADIAVKASLTITFLSMKLGLLTGFAKDVVGELIFSPLGVDVDYLNSVPARIWRFAYPEAVPLLPKRSQSSHKGNLGKLNIVAGSSGMPGALLMALSGASRVGVGLLRAQTLHESPAMLNIQCPQAMIQEAGELVHGSDAILCGPGLGQSQAASHIVKAVLESSVPLLLDADALNVLAQNPEMANVFFNRENKEVVLTPHAGEAARLLGWSIEQVLTDPLEALLTLVETFHCTILLKGSGTLVASPSDQPALISSGNAALATGGMGDLLSGIIAALMVRGLSPYYAAIVGAVLHGEAADIVRAKVGQEGVRPSDVEHEIWALMNGRHRIEST